MTTDYIRMETEPVWSLPRQRGISAANTLQPASLSKHQCTVRHNTARRSVSAGGRTSLGHNSGAPLKGARAEGARRVTGEGLPSSHVVAGGGPTLAAAYAEQTRRARLSGGAGVRSADRAPSTQTSQGDGRVAG